MDVRDIELLSYNSFFGGKLIAYFVSGCDKQKIKIEFIYLLLPLIFKKDSRSILNSATIKSTLSSAFIGNIDGKISLAGLERRIEHFKSLTHTSLMVAAAEYGLKVSDFLSLRQPLDFTKEKDSHIKEFYRSSFYLGSIFSKKDLFETYLELGLKEIWTVI